jgi:hypothetical protein
MCTSPLSVETSKENLSFRFYFITQREISHLNGRKFKLKLKCKLVILSVSLLLDLSRDFILF